MTPPDTPKEIALAFLRLVGLEGKVREGYERYVSPSFRHHNPWFSGAREDLLRAMEDASKKDPNSAIDVSHAVAEGNVVAVHSKVTKRGGKAYAVVHLFRFEGGKIVELWDVGQEVPKESPNANGMF